MNKNVNFILLVLIALIIFAMAGVTVYYQSTYQNISTEFMTRLGELNTTKSALQTQKSKLNQTSVQLEVKTQREKELNDLYQKVLAEKEKLAGDNVKLEITVTKLSAEKKQALEGLQATYLEMASLNESLKEASTRISHFVNKVSDMDDDVNALSSSYYDWLESDTTPDSCKTILEDFQGELETVKDTRDELEDV